MASESKQKISLALQGGGAHGAFTWGVLDRILEAEDLEIEALTATSAGALNAVAMAAGLSEKGRDGAKEKLEAVWKSVSQASGPGAPYGALSATVFAYASALQSIASPYDLNPFNINPLRRVVEGQIDFDAVRASGLKLFLSATNVETGQVKIFDNGELNTDAVLASACLPQTFQAVEIENEAYWDGGYMGNPSLFPLIYTDAPRDVLVVMLNPIEREGVPKTAGEIQERVNEISFNAALIGEMRAIAFVQKLLDDGMLRESMRKKYRRLNIHAIRGGEHLLDLPLRTKYDTSWSFLTSLKDRGREAADAWLNESGTMIGTGKSSFDMRHEFLETEI